ncbi:RelA/SpoT domain-containing protein [Pseudomonas guariconensis]|uniref:RelA/SpoT domain-containing protein n=1 Tax=Pseudomonas guariconensis TaxID=1288410 RepID=UPI00300CCE45
MNFNEYQQHGWAAYAALASTISSILAAAIETEGGYRLQLVKERAKEANSLFKKLQERGIADTAQLEHEIKDLAGCRTVFYTNSDVEKFIHSGIIQENFDVLEVKLHQPGREVKDAADLYISNHYLVTLTEERTKLPEYARFAGMRCEIQIQTILNHAWAEMAHDTIYKAPDLRDFGSRQFKGVKNRLQKVALQYLVPAGYEFQKIAADFQRLLDGKALFDGDALEAIVRATDNNQRVDALERFAEDVLPFYDDLSAVYGDVVTKLLAAADQAKATSAMDIETPYGSLPAKTYADVLQAIADILTHYRYVDAELTFDGLCKLFLATDTEAERKPLMQLGEALAGHQLEIWNGHGPLVQWLLVERIEGFEDNVRKQLLPLLIAVLNAVLSLEISGTSSNFEGFTIRRATVVASDQLRLTRGKAVALLASLYPVCDSETQQRSILLAVNAATCGPRGSSFTRELAAIVLADTLAVLEFLLSIATAVSHQELQAMEERVLHCYWRYVQLPEYLAEHADLQAACQRVRSAALKFRDVVNAEPDYVMYKVLVGYNSVFPPAWERQEFGYEQAAVYRKEQIERLYAQVEVPSAELWFERLNRFAQTESDDLATFPEFGQFLERLAEEKAGMVRSFIEQKDSSLLKFLPAMLIGLDRSQEREQVRLRIESWLEHGEHLGAIAWYLRFTDRFDKELLCRTLVSAQRHGDIDGLRNVLLAAVTQFSSHPDDLIDGVFLPALRGLVELGNFSWIGQPWFSWLNNNLIASLDQTQAETVLNALIGYPELVYGAEYICASIARNWPALVVKFLGDRQLYAECEDAPSRYDALPFNVFELRAPLALVPDLILTAAQEWVTRAPGSFEFDGARLLASIFPEVVGDYAERLGVLIASREISNLAFVLALLDAYEGRDCVYPLMREIVAALPEGRDLLKRAQSVLSASGMVSGAYGFAELYGERKARMNEWLTDEREPVRTFARELIRRLEQRISAENRAAQASIALRKLEWPDDQDKALEE